MRPFEERRADVDWLRVFATYVLLVFHGGAVFNPAAFYHIRSGDPSVVLVVLCGALGLWHVPLFFVRAGWAAFCSLALRGTVGFLRERCCGLSVPVVAACVCVMPAIVISSDCLIRVAMEPWTKFVIVLTVSSGLALSVYHLLIRPFAVPRLMCGMQGRFCALRPQLAGGVITVVGLALLGMATSSAATPTAPFGGHAEDPVGLWYAEGGAAQVEITRCGAGLCGRVVWLRSPFDEDGCELRDRRNPDPALRDRSLIGVEILSGLDTSQEGLWTGGRIYDPTSGNTYRCTAQLDGENRLRLRGYVGVPLLGRTTTWIRVGSENQTCRR